MEKFSQNDKDLLNRYLRGTCTDAESKKVQEWLLANVNAPEYDGMFAEVLDETEPEPDPKGKERVGKKLDDLIELWQSEKRRRPDGAVRSIVLNVLAGAAAVTAVVLAIIFGIQAKSPLKWKQVSVPLGQQKEVVLPDNSRVWLNAGSSLIYPEKFRRRIRQVYLSGEMFADVTHSPSRPFVVSTEKMDVDVHGTMFNVKSYQEDDCVEISLVRGSVSLRIDSERMDGSVNMEPGQIVRFDKGKERLQFLEFDQKTYSNWTGEHGIHFFNEPFGEIVSDLRRRFNEEIVITDKSLCNATYFASFVNDESLDRILEAINSNGSLSITKTDGIYYIKSNIMNKQSNEPNNENATIKH